MSRKKKMESDGTSLVTVNAPEILKTKLNSSVSSNHDLITDQRSQTLLKAVSVEISENVAAHIYIFVSAGFF